MVIEIFFYIDSDISPDKRGMEAKNILKNDISVITSLIKCTIDAFGFTFTKYITVVILIIAKIVKFKAGNPFKSTKFTAKIIFLNPIIPKYPIYKGFLSFYSSNNTPYFNSYSSILFLRYRILFLLVYFISKSSKCYIYFGSPY